MDNFYYFVKRIINIFCQNKRFIIPPLLILSLTFHFSFFPEEISNLFNSKKKTINYPSRILNLRHLEMKNNIITYFQRNIKAQNDSKYIEPLQLNVEKASFYYEFLKNITLYNYYGEWKNLYIKKNIFQEKSGDVNVGFFIRKEDNYLLNLGQKNGSNITVNLLIKDGKYMDYFISSNFTFSLENFSLIENINKKSFNLIFSNISLSYAFGSYMDINKKSTLNNSFINITFYKKFKKFHNKFSNRISSTDYSSISLHILSLSNNDTSKKEFEVEIAGNTYGNYYYPSKILNYSIALTVFALIEIYVTTKFLILVNENIQMALNLDIYTIFVQIMWCSLICGVNFFLSLSHDNTTNEYAMPSMVYFGLFAIFLLRILLSAWKSRNTELMFRDLRQFRKNLFRFYLLFYCLLFVTLISIKIWYTYFIFTFFLFAGTWIFQIYYSAKQGTKPPMPYLYIFFVSLFKMLIPIYLKGYSNNIYSLRPNYFKVLIVDLTVFLEAIIVSAQKLLGPKFFIPKRFREEAFDYYKSENEISQNDKEKECVICLENINTNYKEEENIQKNYKNVFEKFADYVNKWKKEKTTKSYMITPCGHIFHSRCLETWLDVKNECPYCRQKIPPLDN